jgi:hypothetical protein
MSIFPKRTVPGQGVTIHWNFNTAHLKGFHIYPFVRIGVKHPDGKETMLFEGNLLALPDQEKTNSDREVSNSYKYLNKNTPLLVFAEYLSGKTKKEAIVDILGSIQSGRHYYFYFPLSDKAMPGKYTLISEVHSNGEIRYSKTIADDYFFVEKLMVREIIKEESRSTAIIFNPSAESVPVKLVECIYSGEQVQTSIRVFEISSFHESVISFSSERAFLLYNEERELIYLCDKDEVFPLRSQELLFLEKEAENVSTTFVLHNNNKDDAYQLNGTIREIWKNANGIIPKLKAGTEDYTQAYNELLSSGLITEVQLKNEL